MRQRRISTTSGHDHSPTGLTILIADDDPVIRRMLQQRLTAASYQVTTASDGTEAAAQLTSRHYDVLLTDMMMPGDIDGLELLRISKHHDITTEVLLMTAHASVETAIRAMKDGAGDYLEKPINFDELAIRLDKIREVNSLIRHANDLRTAMDTTEQEASQTIQRLELQLADLRQHWHALEEILHDEKLEEKNRLRKALEILESDITI